MIDEVLNEILSAEQRAEKTLATARERVAVIGADTHSACDKVKDEYEIKTKRYVAERMDRAEKEAQKILDDTAVTAQQQIKSEMVTATKNFDSVVEWLTEGVLKESK